MSEATGQHTLSLRLVDNGGACTLRGYPAIELLDRAGRVPFVISHRGDQMVTDRRPTTFVVRARGSAWVLLNHYRCDLGDRREATTVRVAGLGLRLTEPFRRLSWCGKGDPGSVLHVSPFEPAFRATTRHG